MRAFIEVDRGVGLKCLNAGLALKEEFFGRCYVQICVFAQDPILSYPDHGEAMKALLESALAKPGVEGKSYPVSYTAADLLSFGNHAVCRERS